MYYFILGENINVLEKIYNFNVYSILLLSVPSCSDSLVFLTRHTCG